MGNSVWKVYDGKEPLETFLDENRPSEIQYESAPWILVRNEHQEKNGEEEEELEKDASASMRTEWEGLRKNKSVKNITADTLKDLAVKYKYTSGKWMIFASRDLIDDLWFTVAKAVVAGKLGSAAKVSAKKSHDNNHVICVYTKNFTDEDDVRRVEKGLRDSGIHVAMNYKPDIYTTLDIYAKNKFGIPASVYRSPAL